MKCKITYDTHSQLDSSVEWFNGDEHFYDDDGHLAGSKPRKQLYPKTIIIKDGNGSYYQLFPNRQPITRVPGECMLENILLIKQPENVEKNYRYYGDAQRLAEILNTGDFKVVAVNFEEPTCPICWLHDIQIKSMTFYEDNGKQLYDVPSDSFEYEYKYPTDNGLIDDKGTEAFLV